MSIPASPDLLLADGPFRYALRSDWGELPPGWLYNEVAAVGVDSQDHVYVFCRGEHPMIVFDREGRFLRSWGEGIFRRPHGVHVGPDDTIWCTDDGDHTVRAMTPEGKQRLVIGIPGRPARYMSGEPFHRCTHTALSPGGEIYVSDGYGNARVHKFAQDGRLLRSWGEPGTDAGCFNIPHNIVCDDAGLVYVADRENHRVQVFDGHGRYQAQWTNMHRPCALCLAQATGGFACIGESGPIAGAVNLRMPHIGPRLTILDRAGNVLARLGDATPRQPSRFIAPHGLAVDSRGDIYVAEVARTGLKALGQVLPPDRNPRCLHKLVRL